jgi:hypothetical protein
MTHTETEVRRIWVDGTPIDVWESPGVRFSWTPSAIEGYARAERWESLFNALVLIADSNPKGTA